MLTPTSLMQVKQERANAMWSASTGVYIAWRATAEDHSRNRIRLEDFDPTKVDCIRLGPFSRCLCDHSLEAHFPPSFRFSEKFEGQEVNFTELFPIWDGAPRDFPRSFKLVKCSFPGCRCPRFEFVPTFPEEIGESWLPKRPGFDLEAYRPCCRCNHQANVHDVGRPGAPCRQCGCGGWIARYQCAACDGIGPDHTIEVEGEKERAQAGRTYGQAYLPFEEIRDMIKQTF